jgi:mono/diheme cytochrome c family protein
LRYRTGNEASDMSRTIWIRVTATVLIIAAVLFLIRLHNAAGEVSSLGSEPTAGRRLAQAMCSECHTVEPNARRAGRTAPDFVAVANLPSTTTLALNVFLRSSHRNMPNFILAPDDADRIVAYIMSLKRN